MPYFSAEEGRGAAVTLGDPDRRHRDKVAVPQTKKNGNQYANDQTKFRKLRNVPSDICAANVDNGEHCVDSLSSPNSGNK